MTVARVVDSSALAAVVFGEPTAERVAAQLQNAVLVAPVLLGYEITNVCLKKIAANPERRDDFVTALTNWTGFAIDLLEVDYPAVLTLAERTRLTAYDASYLWLARRLGAELITLDGTLGRAAVALV